MTYTLDGDDVTEKLTLTVEDYVEALKSSSDTNVVALVNAFEAYFNAAAAHFNNTDTEEALPELTEDELADLEAKERRDRLGEVAGLEFHSTSLILEEDTTIRHYFKITDDAITTDEDLAQRYTVAGGTSLKISDRKSDSENRYAYVDVVDISSNELATVKTVTVTDTNGDAVTVNYNALSYVDICLEKDDAKLLDLAKALYRYSVASDAYADADNINQDPDESESDIW